MMTSERGWYPDPANEHTMRFWTGTQWIGERVWDGATWVDRFEPELEVPATAAPAPAPPASPVATSTPAPTATRLPMSRTAWLLFGGCAVAAVGTLLPWEQDTTAFGGTVSAGPSSVPGGVAMLMALVAAVVWIAWPTREGAVSKARRVGLTVVAALLTVFAFGKFAALGNAASSSANNLNSGLDSGASLFGDSQTSVGGLSYHAGSGLYIYTAGVLAIWAGVARAWFSGRARP